MQFLFTSELNTLYTYCRIPGLTIVFDLLASSLEMGCKAITQNKLSIMKNILLGLISIFTISLSQAQNSKNQKEEVVCFYVDAEHIACMKLEENSGSKNGKGMSPRTKDAPNPRKPNKIVNGELTREQYEELYLRKLYTKEKVGLDI